MLSPPNFSLNGLEVLIVEDDPTTCLFMSNIIRKCGGHVHAANCGNDGIELFEQTRSRLVVTDICMPGMDGIQMVEGIRKIDPTTQIIAISAHRETDRLISAIELGFSDYIFKPIEVARLLLALKKSSEIIAAREQLANEQNKFKAVVESLCDCLAVKSLDFRVTYQNSAMASRFGDLIGERCYSIWKRTEPCEPCPATLTMADGLPHTTCREYVSEGKNFTIESTVSPLIDVHRNITGTVEIIRDISEKARTEQLLRNIARGVSSQIGEAYLHSLTNYLTESLEMDFALVGTLSADGNKVESLAFCRKGINCESHSYALQGTPCQQAIENGIQVFDKGVAELFPDDTDLRTLSIQSYCGAPLTDSKGRVVGILCTFHTQPITALEVTRDIISIFASRAAAEIERINYEKVIQDLAFHDPLTNLPNRRLFEDRLEQDIAKSRRYNMKFGFMYLDLDNFKQVNDAYGHEIGDLLLIETSERIRSCCKRDLDTMCRKGGDEFCVIITDCGERYQLNDIAEKLLQAFSIPFRIHGTDIRVTISIGISIFPDDFAEPKALEAAADKAMYAAKRSGRNTRVFFDSI